MISAELSFFRLQQLISPSLPIGAFTYSQGMEWAVENRWITDPESLREWLQSCLYNSLVHLELPILMRLYESCVSNDDKFCYWCDYLLASRETKELRLEEQQRGSALVSVLSKLPGSCEWSYLELHNSALKKTALAGLALSAKHWNLSLENVLKAYLWSWLDNMVNVGIKLIPLGQSDGQRILFRLSEELPTAIEKSFQVEDEDIGASTMALAIASSKHESQYCRLFRS